MRPIARYRLLSPPLRPTCMILTPRLRLRRLAPHSETDQDFILELLNQDSFIRFIGDRSVRSREDAEHFLREGPDASFERHGFALMGIETRHDHALVGICGLLQRDFLPHPDIGYSLLDRHTGRGYVQEAAAAVLDWAWKNLKAEQIVATTTPDNTASRKVLERLGFRFEGLRVFPAHPGGSHYFVIDAPARDVSDDRSRADSCKE